MKTVLLSMEQMSQAICEYLENHDLVPEGDYEVKVVVVHDGKVPKHIRIELTPNK